MLVQISVVIITFNEERNIARCLDSVAGVSNDIVVVDSFSTDKTKQICFEKGVRFIEHKFGGHIEQKNHAISQAKNQYVLSLDADEALTEELKATILQIQNNWKYDGYVFNRLTNYCGKWIKHSGWYPDKKLRLWNTTKGNWGGDNPHDKVIMDKNSSVKHVKLNILHYSYYTFEEHAQKITYFANIAANAAFKNGQTSSNFKVFYKTIAKFVRNYILKLGFLDGYYGFLICKNSAKETALKYSILKKLNKNNNSFNY